MPKVLRWLRTSRFPDLPVLDVSLVGSVGTRASRAGPLYALAGGWWVACSLAA